MMDKLLVKKIEYLLLQFLPKNLREKYINGDERSKLIVKNVILSMSMKMMNVICALLLVPITINYVNSDRYGVWLTLSTVVGWITFFDLGLGHGFRNRFAEAKANGDITLARKYVSTTYFSISCLIIVILASILILNNYINWSNFLNLSQDYREELQKVFAIVAIFTSLNMVSNIFSSLLAADMKPGLGAVISGASQFVILAIIYLLTQIREGDLVSLAFCYSGIPFIVITLVSIISFVNTKYSKYAPSFKFIDYSLIKNILNLGAQFALIQIACLAIFQIVSIVITRELGPTAVTQYSISNRYFSVVYMVMNMILTPMWSAYTDAYVRKDYTWMRKTLQRLERIDLLCIVSLAALLVISGPVYHIWVGESVQIPFWLSASMALMMAVQCYAGTYMMCINGTGFIRIQLLIYIACAFVAWPLLTIACQQFGIVGATIVPSVVYMLQAISGRIQLQKIINNKASGLWLK